MFFVLLVCFTFFYQTIEGHVDSSPADWLPLNGGQKIWSLNPSSLEAHCVYQTLHQDKESANWIQYLTGCPKELVFSLASLVTQVGLRKDDNFFIEKERNQEVVRWLRHQFSESLRDELDLGRELIFNEFGSDPNVEEKIIQYATFLDVLSLRARAIYVLRKGERSLSKEEQDLSLISAINTLLFEEIGIRYPSKREMFEEKFSLLSSVVNGKFGVCLGVSSLYLCIAQRLRIPLEIVTPPGHIYLRYLKGSGEYLNIETTAGGCHYETERYEGVDVKNLIQRSLREVIGLTFMNQGSFFLYAKDYTRAAFFYRKASSILGDSLLKELLAVALILSGNETEGEQLLKQLKDDKTQAGSITAQYLNGRINKDALETVFSEPKDNYEDLTRYRTRLQSVCSRYPNFLDAYRKLASICIQLGRTKEAMEALEHCYMKDSEDLSLLLSLCQLYLERMDYLRAKIALTRAEDLALKTQKGQHAVRAIRLHVSKVAP
ncbi:transglutaminase family protein [Chlamydiifrater phoenicopteri]|uniref:transglutaminase family protein n=1 Tax=Chlamydiifrater phoenicopteri TaxID=2681469 RepID=UPI001BCD8490|nr:transglutaminase family protein [Chlamydiifrater phoenicopteri]